MAYQSAYKNEPEMHIKQEHSQTAKSPPIDLKQVSRETLRELARGGSFEASELLSQRRAKDRAGYEQRKAHLAAGRASTVASYERQRENEKRRRKARRAGRQLLLAPDDAYGVAMEREARARDEAVRAREAAGISFQEPRAVVGEGRAQEAEAEAEAEARVMERSGVSVMERVGVSELAAAPALASPPALAPAARSRREICLSIYEALG